jgi:cystathionine beta-lyase/cystathionine gamma-synthase
LPCSSSPTVEVRMLQHEANAHAVARFLAGHPAVRRVLYPGLPDHPGHALQQRQASGFGAMISLDLGTYAAAKTFLEGLRVVSLAESLGGVESLACHPATMTHAVLTAEQRERLGIDDGLVRISVGIENLADLVADLEQALAGI